jgi:hypothetical protein
VGSSSGKMLSVIEENNEYSASESQISFRKLEPCGIEKQINYEVEKMFLEDLERQSPMVLD